MTEQTKTCRLCGTTKPFDAFSRKPDAADGRNTRCKTCIGAAKAARHAARRGTVPRADAILTERECRTCRTVRPIAHFAREVSRTDGRSTRCRACDHATRHGTDPATWKPREPGKRPSEWNQTWRNRHRVAALAHATVYRAKARGQIEPQPCERCPSDQAECHHADYSRPLDCTWLCDVCHRAEHVAAKRLAEFIAALPPLPAAQPRPGIRTARPISLAGLTIVSRTTT